MICWIQLSPNFSNNHDGDDVRRNSDPAEADNQERKTPHRKQAKGVCFTIKYPEMGKTVKVREHLPTTHCEFDLGGA